MMSPARIAFLAALLLSACRNPAPTVEEPAVPQTRAMRGSQQQLYRAARAWAVDRRGWIMRADPDAAVVEVITTDPAARGRERWALRARPGSITASVTFEARLANGTWSARPGVSAAHHHARARQALEEIAARRGAGVELAANAAGSQRP